MNITDIVEDMLCSNFLVTNSTVTCIHYIIVGKMAIKQQGAILFPEKLVKDASAAMPLRIIHLDDPYHYNLLRKKFSL